MEKNKIIKLVATDLDGTFLKNDRSISEENILSLNKLGKQNITRVAATGRNLKKAFEVISSDIPFDFIVYSSGAGIYNCQTKKTIYSKNISVETSHNVARYLSINNLSFHAFHAVPQNYNLWYHKMENANDEFDTYFSFHNSYSTPLEPNFVINEMLCQFLVILPPNENRFYKLKKELEEKFPEIRVIRTTSPLGTGNIWVEVFHKSVSKGNGVLHICQNWGIDTEHTVGIGNDYNDVDLLNFTHHSFLVDNAPEGLKGKYNSALSNEENAFSEMVDLFL